MTSSATQDFRSSVLDASRIPADKLSYFQTRLASRLHQLMLKMFGQLEREAGLTRKVLARRIGRSPEQITRWFSYPGNLTLATTSDIFTGMGYEMESFTLVSLASGARIHCSESQTDWLKLVSTYQRQVAPPPTSFREPNRLSAASEQTMTSRTATVRWRSECHAEPSALSGLASPMPGIGMAATAQSIGDHSRAFN
jgi:DNA-binding phage protein